MTTLAHRPTTALVVIDVQNDVVNGAHDRDGVVARISDLVGRARASGTPLVWVQHCDDGLVEGTRGWDLVDELARHGDEPLVRKHHGDAFEGTDMEEVLAHRGVGHLVVAGAETDVCIRSTIHGAFTRGYDVTLVSDAHTASDKTPWGAPPVDQVITHTNLYWRFHTAPGRTADVAPAADIAFAPTRP